MSCSSMVNYEIAADYARHQQFKRLLPNQRAVSWRFQGRQRGNGRPGLFSVPALLSPCLQDVQQGFFVDVACVTSLRWVCL